MLPSVRYLLAKVHGTIAICMGTAGGFEEEYFGQMMVVAAIRHIFYSCLDPNDFTVVNCIVKGNASLSPPSLRLRLCSRFTLLATYTYFDPKDFSPHPSTVSKVMRPFHPLLNKKQIKKKKKRNIDSQSRRKVFVNSAK
ncbi:uncharacterized protein TNCV_3061 [Trichonephila clavipes]|nr:uncharacterized protein TNCV_3061 [Trichonephila clavipes]